MKKAGKDKDYISPESLGSGKYKVESRERKPSRKPLVLKLVTVLAIGGITFGLIFFMATSERFRLLFEKDTPTPGESQILQTEESTPFVDYTASASLAFAGDALFHRSLIEGALKEDGTHDFNYMFTKIRPYIEEADYALVNFKGVLAGSPYTGYDLNFRAPDAVVPALRVAGFDMAVTATNNSYDGGMSGLLRTPKAFRDYGMKAIGTRETPEEPGFKTVEINGIKFAFAAYTYETLGTETNRALNGIIMPQSANELVDSFNPERPDRFEQDKQEMALLVDSMKESGAECIVFAMHWGHIYHRTSWHWQNELAEHLSDLGVDIIFGGHPGVVQEIEVLSSKISGKDTLVYYSVGNLISNMTYSQTNPNGIAEDGIIAKVLVERDSDGKISVKKGEYIGVYVLKTQDEEDSQRRIHTVVPVRQALENPAEYGIEGYENLVRDSMERTNNHLEPYTGTHHGILIGEYID